MGVAKTKRIDSIYVSVLLLSLSACAGSDDSCDGLEGTITHSDIEITGVKSASVFKRNSDGTVAETVDQVSGVEFSNLSIDIDLSWIEEQHRFREPNTFIQSALAWFVAPAMACSFPPYFENFQPGVSNIEVYSDSDINDEILAGTDLSALFTTSQLSYDSDSNLTEASENGSLLSARSYSLYPASTSELFSATSVTPEVHTFTIFLALDDGRTFEIQTPAVLISGS